MLTIRREQMAAFGDMMRGNLARRVAERVTLTRPAKIQELGDSDFRELIALCMGKSERYGIDGERDLATLAEFMLDISSNFEATCQNMPGLELC